MSRILLLALLTTMISFSLIPVTGEGADASKPLELNKDGGHEVRIEASQWEFNAYDMVQVARLIEEGMSEKEAMAESHYKHRIGSFEKDTLVTLTIVSRDVQHGFSINEEDLNVATNRPGVGEEYGAPTITTFTTPNEDVTYSAFCHIFCGLGHPDMKLKFVIGKGSPEYGRFVFWGVIAINVGIIGVTFSKLYKKLNEEVVTA